MQTLTFVLFGVVFAGSIYLWSRWKESATRAEIQEAERQRTGVAWVTCGNCHTRNAERVKVRTRATSAVAGGLIFSRKARAQFHCRTCNTYW